uniref:Uncharacterized protein n=1 Tax=Rhizophora mucronata TaxID=61149 RepID=A0A2P2MG27_RHIMU
MPCIKQQESLLPIWVPKRQSASTDLFYFLESGMILRRIKGCIFLYMKLSKSLFTNLLLLTREFCFLCASQGHAI